MPIKSLLSVKKSSTKAYQILQTICTSEWDLKRDRAFPSQWEKGYLGKNKYDKFQPEWQWPLETKLKKQT